MNAGQANKKAESTRAGNLSYDKTVK